MAEAETVETVAHDNLSQSHVLIVVRKILYHSNQAVIAQYCAGIVSKRRDRANPKRVPGVSRVSIVPIEMNGTFLWSSEQNRKVMSLLEGKS